jgi:hypothetical protein
MNQEMFCTNCEESVFRFQGPYKILSTGNNKSGIVTTKSTIVIKSTIVGQKIIYKPVR